MVEALGPGVEKNKLSKYRGTEYHLVSIGEVAGDCDRNQVAIYAESCLDMKYGYFDIVSIAFSLMTGSRFAFGFDGQAICSGLVARALERTDAIFNRDPEHIIPADLAKYFLVQAPPEGTNIGIIPK